jgi:hypothetical protein
MKLSTSEIIALFAALATKLDLFYKLSLLTWIIGAG